MGTQKCLYVSKYNNVVLLLTIMATMTIGQESQDKAKHVSPLSAL